MPTKTSLLASAAGLAALVLQASAPAFAQNAAALSGAVSSAKEGPMEGVRRQRQEGRLDHHRLGRHRRQGPLQLPGVAARSRALRDQHPRHRLRSRRAQGRHHRRGPRGQDRRHAQAGAKPQRAAHQRRVAHERARQRRAEAIPARMQQLPHPGAHRAFDPRRRRVHAGVQAHGPLLSGQHAAQAAAARRQRRTQYRQRSASAASRRVARQHQFEPAGHLELAAQDAAAADRQIHPRHHHRVRPAE